MFQSTQVSQGSTILQQHDMSHCLTVMFVALNFACLRRQVLKLFHQLPSSKDDVSWKINHQSFTQDRVHFFKLMNQSMYREVLLLADVYCLYLHYVPPKNVQNWCKWFPIPFVNKQGTGDRPPPPHFTVSKCHKHVCSQFKPQISNFASSSNQ